MEKAALKLRVRALALQIFQRINFLDLLFGMSFEVERSLVPKHRVSVFIGAAMIKRIVAGGGVIFIWSRPGRGAGGRSHSVRQP